MRPALRSASIRPPARRGHARWLSLLCALGAAVALPVRPVAAQHTHGVAALDLGVSGVEGTLEFRATGEDLWGFERAPRTAADRQARDGALARLRRDGGALVRLAPALGCAVTADTIGTSRTAQGHEEVRARYALRCRKPLAGVPIGFGVTALFPRITRVRVQMLSDTAQVGREVVRDQGRVVPE